MNNELPKIRLTFVGFFIFLLGAFLLFSAANTGNNLLFLVAAVLLAMVIISTVTAVFNIKALLVEAAENICCFEGEVLNVSIKLRNGSKNYCFQISCGSNFVHVVNPGRTMTLKHRLNGLTRGKYVFSDLFVQSSFPFGIINSAFRMAPITAWVFPKPLSVDVTGSNVLTKAVEFSKLETQGDFWSHNQYIPGEDARQISWVLSARSEDEWTILRTLPKSFPARVRFDISRLSRSEFETFLMAVCGLCVECHTLRTETLVWHSDDEYAGEWVNVSSDDGFTRVLKWLAELTPETPLNRIDEVESEDLVDWFHEYLKRKSKISFESPSSGNRDDRFLSTTPNSFHTA